MCFSAGASFTAAAVCSTAGAATLRKVPAKKYFLFACFPLVFGFQQLIEGALWLVHKNILAQDLAHGLTLAYLLLAFVFWPIASPLGIFLTELKTNRQKIVLPFLLLGICVGGYLFWGLIQQPFSSHIADCSIKYEYIQHMPYRDAVRACYLTAAFIPYLFSSHRGIRLFGVVNILSFFIARHFYLNTYISVWCFFAAGLSGLIYFIFRWGFNNK